jgi:hypothetical protein
MLNEVKHLREILAALRSAYSAVVAAYGYEGWKRDYFATKHESLRSE